MTPTALGGTGVAVGAGVRVAVGLTPGVVAVGGAVGSVMTPPPPVLPPPPDGSVGVPPVAVAVVEPGVVPWITWSVGVACSGSYDMPMTDGPVESCVCTEAFPSWS